MALVVMWGCSSDEKPPPAPSFTLRAPSEPTLRFAPENATPLIIEVTRESSFTGALSLTLEGLPAHVQAEATTVFLSGADSTGTFQLHVEELAAYGRFPIRVVGDGGVGRVELSLTLEVQPGQAALDLSFGSGGLALPALGRPVGIFVRMAVQPDGKWILASSTGAAGSRDVLVARLLPDGTPDVSFGTQGTRIIDVCGGEDDVRAVTVLSDGRIMLAGSAVSDTNGCTALNRQSLLLVRLTATGELDSTFGTAGVWTFQLSKGTATLNSLTVDSQGRVVGAGTVTGTGSDSDQVMVRLLPTGQLDTSFGADGLVIEDYGQQDSGSVVLALADDALLLGGTTREHADGLTLRRYQVNGERDLTFNFVPRALAASKLGPRRLYSLEGGKVLVVAGSNSGEHNTDNGVSLVQVDATGAADASFGLQGHQYYETPGTRNRDIIAGSGLLPGGEIALATWYEGMMNDTGVGTIHVSSNGERLRRNRVDLPGRQRPTDAWLDAEGYFRVVGLHTAPGQSNEVLFVARFWPY
ncbi:hypothetical protein LZ199_27810 [Myxococcus sp. QH3KD-4-1]|nr:hypothetical protein [Myxococcus qinghaiensis]